MFGILAGAVGLLMGRSPISLIVAFIQGGRSGDRRLKSLLYKQSPPARTEEIGDYAMENKLENYRAYIQQLLEEYVNNDCVGQQIWPRIKKPTVTTPKKLTGQ